MGRAKKQYDVIIIGAGLSGLIAARELEMLGHRVLIVEARDRLGGRAWTSKQLNRNLEMGGAYVHWHQPHIWTELTRYGLAIQRVAETKTAYWITEDSVRKGSVEKLSKLMKKDVEAMMVEANTYLPHPFEAFGLESIQNMDDKSIVQFIKESSLSREQQDVLSSWTGISFNGPFEKGALTQMFRWWAFANGNRALFTDTVGRYKIKGGSSALIKALSSELQADIKYETIVDSIHQSKAGVAVYAEDGTMFQGSTVIVTTPFSTLKKLHFMPPLSQTKQAFIAEEQISKGCKVWIKLKGKYDPIVTYAPSDYPLQSIIVDDYIGEDTLFVGFGIDATKIDASNKEAVQQAIRHWLPEAEVIDVASHNWVQDPFSLETWPMLKTNQLTNYIAEMRRPEENIFFAGTTYAKGWAGFFDGAIENGITTGRMVHQHLQKNVK